MPQLHEVWICHSEAVRPWQSTKLWRDYFASRFLQRLVVVADEMAVEIRLGISGVVKLYPIRLFPYRSRWSNFWIEAR